MNRSGRHRYLLALGSNMRHSRAGPPRAVMGAAIAALAQLPVAIEAVSRVVESAPLGPSNRRYANGCVLVSTALEPLQLLARVKRIERSFGRRGGGRKWRARVLDVDIVLWEGGLWASPGLLIPHPQFRVRDFVLGPASEIAPGWRDPVTRLTVAQLHARLTKPRPAPR